MNKTCERPHLRVSPRVAALIGPDSLHEQRLNVARGLSELQGVELVTALVYLSFGRDGKIGEEAMSTLGKMPAAALQPMICDPSTAPKILHFIAVIRREDKDSLACLLKNPAVSDKTLLFLGREARGEILALLAESERLNQCPGLREMICANPQTDPSIKSKLGCDTDKEISSSAKKQAPERHQKTLDKHDAEDQNATETATTSKDAAPMEGDLNASKYQLSLDMTVSEKIKMALTGDKEWRSIFLRDANKLVSSAVLKNPRISDGEVLAVARNRSTSDDLIRIVLLNTEWVKNNEIKKALAVHPRTPLPKALRFMSSFSEKELKQLAKSRNVSQVIVNSARRLLMSKEKGR